MSAESSLSLCVDCDADIFPTAIRPDRCQACHHRRQKQRWAEENAEKIRAGARARGARKLQQSAKNRALGLTADGKPRKKRVGKRYVALDAKALAKADAPSALPQLPQPAASIALPPCNPARPPVLSLMPALGALACGRCANAVRSTRSETGWECALERLTTCGPYTARTLWKAKVIG